jgi:hypothetical protein
MFEHYKQSSEKEKEKHGATRALESKKRDNLLPFLFYFFLSDEEKFELFRYAQGIWKNLSHLNSDMFYNFPCGRLSKYHERDKVKIAKRRKKESFKTSVASFVVSKFRKTVIILFKSQKCMQCTLG